ncbi:hypothetical protein pipiens_007718 [Culex pipiens pipiens]|uniref:Uncharacterized protein n=1 Tax=Culex pipiens pipiens TaxID=38569 RepID=A0ABD1DK61_CULPP
MKTLEVMSYRQNYSMEPYYDTGRAVMPKAQTVTTYSRNNYTKRTLEVTNITYARDGDVYYNQSYAEAYSSPGRCYCGNRSSRR